jgi:hypothetical protein
MRDPLQDARENVHVDAHHNASFPLMHIIVYSNKSEYLCEEIIQSHSFSLLDSCTIVTVQDT